MARRVSRAGLLEVQLDPNLDDVFEQPQPHGAPGRIHSQPARVPGRTFTPPPSAKPAWRSSSPVSLERASPVLASVIPRKLPKDEPHHATRSRQPLSTPARVAFPWKFCFCSAPRTVTRCRGVH